MKILLPSLGIYGQKSVELKVPTLQDLRDITNYNVDELYKKARLVSLLSDANFSKITYDDFNYIYDIAAFSVVLNKLDFTIQCSCGNNVNTSVYLSKCDIKQLELKKKDLPVSFRSVCKKVQYRLLSAQDVIDAYDSAQVADDEDQSFILYKINRMMCRPLEDSYSKELSLSQALSAEAFQKMNYHGIVKVGQIKCPNCGKVTTFGWKIEPKSIELSIDRLMSMYSSMYSFLDLKSFYNLTLTEYNSLVNSINKKLK